MRKSPPVPTAQGSSLLMLSKNIPAVYSILLGITMAGMWTVFIITGQIPEFETRPLEILFHLSAELLTALGLVAGGLGLLLGRRWGYKAYLVAMGMLLYTVIQSPGYYAQAGNLTFVVMFAILFLMTFFFIIYLIFMAD